MKINDFGTLTAERESNLVVNTPVLELTNEHQFFGFRKE